MCSIRTPGRNLKEKHSSGQELRCRSLGLNSLQVLELVSQFCYLLLLPPSLHIKENPLNNNFVGLNEDFLPILSLTTGFGIFLL
jgi:hypothetical protein